MLPKAQFKQLMASIAQICPVDERYYFEAAGDEMIDQIYRGKNPVDELKANAGYQHGHRLGPEVLMGLQVSAAAWATFRAVKELPRVNIRSNSAKMDFAALWRTALIKNQVPEPITDKIIKETIDTAYGMIKSM